MSSRNALMNFLSSLEEFGSHTEENYRLCTDDTLKKRLDVIMTVSQDFYVMTKNWKSEKKSHPTVPKPQLLFPQVQKLVGTKLKKAELLQSDLDSMEDYLYAIGRSIAKYSFLIVFILLMFEISISRSSPFQTYSFLLTFSANLLHLCQNHPQRPAQVLLLHYQLRLSCERLVLQWQRLWKKRHWIWRSMDWLLERRRDGTTTSSTFSLHIKRYMSWPNNLCVWI